MRSPSRSGFWPLVLLVFESEMMLEDLCMRVQGCARMHVREQGHTCTTTAVAEGASETPCCESAEVNIPLTYTCYSAPGRRDWIAKLSPEGEDTGPWADRGPWRGCRPGDVGMMRLERVR